MGNLMTRKQFTSTFVFIIITQIITAQTIKKSFSGCWGDTGWKFEFSENGKFKRISSGHYGNTTITGKYRIKNDTIQIISGFKDTYGTVNEYYVVDENNTLSILS